VQLWFTHVAPFKQMPQSTLVPHAVPPPHSQSTPHVGTWQQIPLVGSHLSIPQPQSVGQLAQFSPNWLAQIESPHMGLQLPPWQVVPDAHTPQEPPQPLGPHDALAQDGVQQLGAGPVLVVQT
jgi:hypothetical protein